MSGRVLVVASAAPGNAAELLGLAHSLSGAQADAVAAAALGGVDVPALVAAGAQVVYTLAHPLLDQLNVEAMAAAIVEVCRAAEPDVVLLNHNAIGADLAPRVAFRLNGNAVTGCVAVDRGGEGYRYTRPRQGGIAREVLSFRNGPVVATIRAGQYEALPPDASRAGKTVPIAYDPAATAVRTRIVERVRDSSDAGSRLEDAKIIVAGGRGLEGPDGFRVLEDLARTLGGVVGASRVPCDLGWCPRSWQIGLTGKTVLPDLYIAVGISGASHHMAGCGNAKTIVAVNTDPAAAIFRDARYGVAGDYREFIPALIAELRKV